MGLDINPLIPAGRQLIQGYGDGRFRIANKVHSGSVLVFPEYTIAWPVDDAMSVTVDSLRPVTTGDPVTDILLVGCGAHFLAAPTGLAQRLRAEGVIMEWMDTGAACRTFNLLLTEERRVAAALIAVA